MPAPRPTAPLASSLDDPQRARDLARMKRLATGLFLARRRRLPRLRAARATTPGAWVGYVRATAEASMVGALADWFAVTALFRHPLGLPIPHTAIIPRKKDQIGASLGTFVQENFLTRSRGRGEADHRSTSPAGSAPSSPPPGRAERLAGDAGAVVTALTELLRDEDLEPAVAGLVDRKLHATPAAPAVARVLELVVEGDRHQEVLSAALRGLARFLQENRLVFRAQLGDASPAWVPDWVDDRVFDRVFAGLQGFLEEVGADPRHELRRSYDARLRAYVHALRTDPDTAGAGRGPEEGAARAPRRPHLVGLAVDQREERRPHGRRRPGLRAAGPAGRDDPGRRPAAADRPDGARARAAAHAHASPATWSSGSPATSPTWSAAPSPAGTPRRPAAGSSCRWAGTCSGSGSTAPSSAAWPAW